MSFNEVLNRVEERMVKSVASVMESFSSVRTGKASPALVENITVDYYGTPTRIKELAGISTPEPRLIVINPWDPTAVSAVEKAIMKANIGLTPVVDGKLIRLPIPELSEERRQEMDKVVKKMAEEGRVAIRNIRRDGNDELEKVKKTGEITEDDLFNGQKLIQDKTNKHIKEIDDHVKKKEDELLNL